MMYLSICQVCYNQRCEEIKNIKEYGTNDCSAKCNNRGVKNVSTSQNSSALNSKDIIADCVLSPPGL